MAAQGHAYDIITVKRRLWHLRSLGHNSAHVTAAAGARAWGVLLCLLVQ